MNKLELKPCPFCGERPILKADDRYPRPERERITAYEVVCDNSDCIIYRADNVYLRTEQEAIDKWNKRAEQAAMSESLKGGYYGKLIAEGLRTEIETMDSQIDKSEWIPVEYHMITEEEKQENDYPADWIYCIDSPMPEEGQEILITTNAGYVEKDTCLYDYDGGTYYTDSGYDWCGEILAWMPLPKPYHTESEDK